jgi:flagellar hook-associated protein 2
MADIASISNSSVETLVQQYRTSLRKPILSLENRKTTLNARMSALLELKGKLQTLYSTSLGLSRAGTSSDIQKLLVESSDSTIAAATALSTATIGSHAISVSQLAKSDTILSDRITSNSTTIIDSEGAGEKTIRITVNGVSKDVSISLEAGDTNQSILSKISTAVNLADTSVGASVVSDTSTTSRLVFTSKKTGSDNAMVMSDITGGLLSDVGLTSAILTGRTSSSSTTGGFLYSPVDTLNSKFNVDGIDLIRQSNTVSDAITGVTLQLKRTQLDSSVPVMLTVQPDKEKIKTLIDKFITDYNSALSYLTAKTAIDPQNNIRQILASDTMFLGLRINIRSVAGSLVSGGEVSQLADLGITIAKDGTLTMSDSAKLEKALDENISNVGNLFSSTGGIAIQLKNLLDGFVSSGGRIDATRDGAKTQVDGINSRIKRMDSTISKKVERYRDEFAKLQSLLITTSLQQQTLQSIAGGIY